MDIEVARASRSQGALAGRVLAQAPDEAEITRQAMNARAERPEANLWTFCSGELIPHGLTVIFGRR